MADAEMAVDYLFGVAALAPPVIALDLGTRSFFGFGFIEQLPDLAQQFTAAGGLVGGAVGVKRILGDYM